MASRMEKYYSNNSRSNTRSVKNENLYKGIYENTEYSNIEGIATIEKTNEINLEQIKELLREREERKKKEEISKSVPEKVYEKPIYEEKNYDIRDVLSKAKDEHVEDKTLRNTEYNILKDLDIKDKLGKTGKIDLEKTLADTSILKNLDDNELCLDLLDLKSTGNTMVTSTDLLKEVQEAKDKYEPKEDDGLDKSFYTSSLNFKDEDFEQLKDIQDSIDSNNKLIKVLFAILFIIIIGVVGFVLYKLL